MSIYFFLFVEGSDRFPSFSYSFQSRDLEDRETQEAQVSVRPSVCHKRLLDLNQLIHL